MSDSDNDLLPNNVFSFQNENTTVWARGPNINKSNLTGLSFRNNVLTSTMQMSRNFEPERFSEGGFRHRNTYYRRETSPMSMYSASEMRTRNLNHSYYSRGMSSQRSAFNGRSGSPMSVRTTDSTASVSATDIAMAFKNMNFNKYDLRIIKDAYNKFMKHQVRKKIEKRRNLRLFMKGMQRRKSGYDSGEQGSDSSISSNDCRSTKGSVYKENASSGRSTRTDLTDFKRTMIDSNMYKDCSENFKQSTFRNMFSVGPKSVDNIRQDKLQPSKSTVQGERFKNGFVWPSQRFNRKNLVAPIQEDNERVQLGRNDCKRTKLPTENMAHDSGSEQDEIFSEITVRENSTQNMPCELQQKRHLENKDDNVPNRKRTKISSPIKKPRENKKPSPIQAKGVHPNDDDRFNDFEFVKPTFPVRKSANMRTQQERLLSKSSQPKDIAENVPKIYASPKRIHEKEKMPKVVINNEDKQVDNGEEPSHTLSTSDIAMRPSFIKRKLFTQKLDVTEKRNASSDSLSTNSPGGNVYNAIQKEKHRARKLVTSQSCLSRDVQEDNNLIDLIHKIVPPDRINMTQTNKSDVSSKQNKSEDDDRWDVTSVITTCNDDNVSDTYTDEEIFKDEKPKSDKPSVQPSNVEKKTKDCRIVIEKIPSPNNLLNSLIIRKGNLEQYMTKSKNIEYSKNVSANQTSHQTCIKSFWDTDLESDIECTAPRHNNYFKDNQTAGNLSIQDETKKQFKPKSDLKHVLPNKESNKSLNNNIDKTLKINTTNLKIRSHRTPKNKKCCTDQSYLDFTKTHIAQNKSYQINQHKPSAIKETPVYNVQDNQLNGDTLLNDTVMHNTSRPIRSCRISKNGTMNSSRNVSMNTSDVGNTTLGSNFSKAKLSPVKNTKKVTKKATKNKANVPEKIQEVKSRASDVSFSLASEAVQNKNLLNGSQMVTRGQSRELKTSLVDLSLSLSSNKKSTVANDKTMSKQKLNNSKIVQKVVSVVKKKKMDDTCCLRSSKRLTPQKKAVASKKTRANKN